MEQLLTHFSATAEVQAILTHLLKVTPSLKNIRRETTQHHLANQVCSCLCQSSTAQTSYFRIC